MKRSIIIIVVWPSCQDLFGHTVKLQLYSSLVLETKVRNSIWPYEFMSKHIKLFPQCDEHLFFSVTGVRNH